MTDSKGGGYRARALCRGSTRIGIALGAGRGYAGTRCKRAPLQVLKKYMTPTSDSCRVPPRPAHTWLRTWDSYLSLKRAGPGLFQATGFRRLVASLPTLDESSIWQRKFPTHSIQVAKYVFQQNSYPSASNDARVPAGRSAGSPAILPTGKRAETEEEGEPSSQVHTPAKGLGPTKESAGNPIIRDCLPYTERNGVQIWCGDSWPARHDRAHGRDSFKGNIK